MGNAFENSKMKHLIDDLRWRGLIRDSTNMEELIKDLDAGCGVYAGFDPTASSLHVGSLLPIVTLERFRRAGVPTFALVGGATALVGDPSGRRTERALSETAEVESRAALVAAQLTKLCGAHVVNNAQWTSPMGALELLRDVGKHFSVSSMLAKESVAARLAEGISFTEFAYQLLQANDFAHLFVNHNVKLQIGGSDQWGNITSGISLIRKRHGGTAHGLTMPLLTTSSGVKMGKTAKGALWLDESQSSAHELFQFLFNTDDADVAGLLKTLTFMSEEEISLLLSAHGENRSARLAQRELARQVTRFVHGEDALVKAEETQKALFGALDAESLLSSEGTPRVSCVLPIPLEELLVFTGLCLSKNEARRLITGGGARVNGVKAELGRIVSSEDLLNSKVVRISSGRKHHVLVLPE